MDDKQRKMEKAKSNLEKAKRQYEETLKEGNKRGGRWAKSRRYWNHVKHERRLNEEWLRPIIKIAKEDARDTLKRLQREKYRGRNGKLREMNYTKETKKVTNREEIKEKEMNSEEMKENKVAKREQIQEKEINSEEINETKKVTGTQIEEIIAKIKELEVKLNIEKEKNKKLEDEINKKKVHDMDLA